MVSQGITDVSGAIQRYYEGIAGDPCQAVLAGRESVDNYESLWLDYQGWLGEASDAIRRAQEDALGTWGEGADSTAVPFVDVLWDAGARPPDLQDAVGAQIFLAFLTLGLLSPLVGGVTREAWSARLYSALPAPGQAPPAHARGTQLAPGIFLWAGNGASDETNVTTGILTGPRVVELYRAWRDGVRASAGPSDWPRWAEEMAYMTGDSRWRPGDPIGGYVGAYAAVLEQLYGAIDRAENACNVRRSFESSLTQQGIDAVIEGANEDRKAARERTWILAAVAIVALKMRGKR